MEMRNATLLGRESPLQNHRSYAEAIGGIRFYRPAAAGAIAGMGIQKRLPAFGTKRRWRSGKIAKQSGNDRRNR
jgi:hypothetical protein